MSPLIMKLEVHTQPVVPLGVMGCFFFTAGLLCHCFLPKTKGATAEIFDDSSEMARFKAWSPKVNRQTEKKRAKRETRQVEMTESIGEGSINDECSDDYAVRFSISPSRFFEFLLRLRKFERKLANNSLLK